MIGEPAGAFLVITHSAALVPMGNAGDLASLVRIENETGQTRGAPLRSRNTGLATISSGTHDQLTAALTLQWRSRER
jgi:hypothetical protein